MELQLDAELKEEMRELYFYGVCTMLCHELERGVAFCCGSRLVVRVDL